MYLSTNINHTNQLGYELSLLTDLNHMQLLKDQRESTSEKTKISP